MHKILCSQGCFTFDKNSFLLGMKKVIFCLFFISTFLIFNNCTERTSKGNDIVIGTWQVAEGRNTGAIFEFTKESRLNIYGGSLQAFWFGFENKAKKNLQSSKYRTTPSVSLGKPDEQGELTWMESNKIKF